MGGSVFDADAKVSGQIKLRADVRDGESRKGAPAPFVRHGDGSGR